MSKNIRKQPKKKFFRDSLEENSGHNKKGKICDRCHHRKKTDKCGDEFLCSDCQDSLPVGGEK